MAKEKVSTYDCLNVFVAGVYIYLVISLSTFWQHALLGITLCLYLGNLMTRRGFLLELYDGDKKAVEKSEAMLNNRGSFLIAIAITGILLGLASYFVRSLFS